MVRRCAELVDHFVFFDHPQLSPGDTFDCLWIATQRFDLVAKETVDLLCPLQLTLELCFLSFKLKEPHQALVTEEKYPYKGGKEG